MSKITLRDVIGLEGVTLGEAVGLVSLVVISMVYVGMVNPSALGSTFFTFGTLAYLIAVFISARRQGQYDP